MRTRSLTRAALSLGLAVAAGAVAVSPAASAAPRASQPNSPIKHVIEIMLENHTFDSLFGHFPGANGIPQNVSFLNPNAYYTSAPDVSPVLASPNEGSVQGAINNSRVGEQMAMNYQPGRGYQMNYYTVFPQDGISSITGFGPQFDPNLQYLAKNYELADRNFQPAIAPTGPNVLYALTGTAHGWMYNDKNPNDTAPWPSIFRELASHGLTGKFYSAIPSSFLPFLGNYYGQIVPNSDVLTTADQFFSDLAQGNLPNFSFVRPGSGYTQEPPEDLTEGDAWLGQLVSAVARSKYWNSTAIFVTYDEGGGFWDHVVPPTVTQYGYGTRTPTVIVSPYARKGVFSQQTTNMSIMSFMQRLWHLPPLNGLNAQQNSLMTAFDFHQAPLPAPVMPAAPAHTIGFHDTSSDFSDLPAINPGQSLKVNLEAETGGLGLDSAVSGPVTLTVTPPAKVTMPSSFPTSATFSGGRASFSGTFPAAGYYRIKASGPGGSVGWTTVDVGVDPDTAPAP